MKQNKISFITMALMLLIGTESFAQFKLSGQIRPRTEYRHGFKKLIGEEQKAALFTEQRTRLIANYTQEKITLKVSLQDVRIWGSDNQIYKPSDAPQGINMNEAWASYAFDNGLALKVGRQELNYDNARFLGNLGWAQQSRSHDALLLKYAKNGSSFHIGGAFNQNGLTPEYRKLLGTSYGKGGANYKVMQFLWYNKKFDKGSISALLFNDGKESADESTINYSHTLGLVSKFPAGKINLETEAYYQFGKNAGGADLSSFLLAANASYKASKLTTKIGIDYLSGTKLDAEAGTDNSFNPLYGTNHKFYGFMDYFYVGNATKQGGKTIGVIDPYLSLTYAIDGNNKIMANTHYFSSAVDIYEGAETTADKLSKSLGTEIDLVYSIKLKQGVGINFGYSQMFGTNAMEAIKGGSKSLTNNWGWTMITFSPTFFDSSKNN